MDKPRTSEKYRVVVVPIAYQKDVPPDGVAADRDVRLPRRRHSGHWECAVASSDHPSCPVGEYRIVVSAAELARGQKIDLAAVVTPS